MKSEKCEIYTDVDGVYSEDPNKNPDAIRFEEISYDKMLHMAQKGAKVLHSKCVELAKKYGVEIVVKSTFLEESRGTIVK